MSYFGFLLVFLVVPLGFLLLLAGWDRRRGRKRAVALNGWPIALALALHVLIALLYTTPWDNYLVATGVWSYDPSLVTGFTLGWVPIEEYTFFVLQPILGGLWLWTISRRLDAAQAPLRTSLRRWSTMAAALLWLGSVAMLLSGWSAGTYLGLELAWALPPIALQLAFGADILWRHKRHLLLAILPLTVYLSAADALAIQSGTWTIHPETSLNILIGGILPLEEVLFFLLTNTLVVFGLLLVWSVASQERLASLKEALARLWPGEAVVPRALKTQDTRQSEEISA